MPALGESITDGTISVLLKQPGDAVAEDEPIMQIETDKVVIDVRAPHAGVLEQFLVSLSGAAGRKSAALHLRPAVPAACPSIAIFEPIPALFAVLRLCIWDGRQAHWWALGLWWAVAVCAWDKGLCPKYHNGRRSLINVTPPSPCPPACNLLRGFRGHGRLGVQRWQLGIARATLGTHADPDGIFGPSVG